MKKCIKCDKTRVDDEFLKNDLWCIDCRIKQDREKK